METETLEENVRGMIISFLVVVSASLGIIISMFSNVSIAGFTFVYGFALCLFFWHVKDYLTLKEEKNEK